MTEDVKEYTREECLPKFISPTGVEYSVFRLGEVDLYEIRATREDEMGHKKPDLRAQQPVSGTFTGHARAITALVQYLTLAWDASDAKKLKNLSRKAAA